MELKILKSAINPDAAPRMALPRGVLPVDIKESFEIYRKKIIHELHKIN